MKEYSGKTVLYVEDERLTSVMVTKMLKNMGFDVVVAFDGEEGFMRYLEISPDLILTDLKMPVMCGCKMISRIREIDSVTPIIVMSVKENLRDFDINKVPKPVNNKNLTSAIHRVFEGVSLNKPENEKSLFAINHPEDYCPFVDK